MTERTPDEKIAQWRREAEWYARPTHAQPMDATPGKIVDAVEFERSRADTAEAELAKYHAEEQRRSEWNAMCEADNVRCIDCDLRYAEREEYPCSEYGLSHRYDEDELREARELKPVKLYG